VLYKVFARNRKFHAITSTSSFKLRDYRTNVASSPKASRLSWSLVSSFQFPNTEFRIQHGALALVTYFASQGACISRLWPRVHFATSAGIGRSWLRPLVAPRTEIIRDSSIRNSKIRNLYLTFQKHQASAAVSIRSVTSKLCSN
jgi:hypothetical protein